METVVQLLIGRSVSKAQVEEGGHWNSSPQWSASHGHREVVECQGLGPTQTGLPLGGKGIESHREVVRGQR